MTGAAPASGAGRVARVSGPLVEVRGLTGLAMSDIVEVGPARLPGEVVAISGDRATVQAYEYTGGLAPGDVAAGRGEPLSARLGPQLLGGVFDGLLRPLQEAGAWLDPARPAVQQTAVRQTAVRQTAVRQTAGVQASSSSVPRPATARSSPPGAAWARWPTRAGCHTGCWCRRGPEES